MMKETSSYSWLKYIAKILSEAEMAYNTTIFWMFLIVFLGIYLLLRKPSTKRIWVLIGSITFYVWSGIGALVIVLGTALIVYATSRKIESIYEKFDIEKEGLTPKEQVALFNTYKKRAIKFLWGAAFVVIGLWVYVKIAKLLNFVTVESFSDMSFGVSILVPLGISYYTLSTVGYLLDVYWRKAKVEHNFLNLFSAMIYFPHIMQGPISKYSKIIEQMKNLPNIEYSRVCYGLQLMLWGYIKKMIIADRLVIYTGAVFGNPSAYGGVEVVLAVLLCVIQLYADFSGCMDIVRGISQVVGIELEQNFRQPFFAKNAQEFWARWHMSLGAWTKEYIYLPIAMNPKFSKYTRTLKKNGKPWRASFIKAFLPLVTVWIFTGLWHGTGVDYLLWGLYWCTLMTLSKELQPFADKVIKKYNIDVTSISFQIFSMVRTSLLFALGRIITVTGSLTGGMIVCKQMLTQHKLWVLFDDTLFSYGLDKKDFYIAIIGVVGMLIVDVLHERGVEIRTSISKQALPIRWTIYYAAIIAVVIFGMYGPDFDAASFVYGAF